LGRKLCETLYARVSRSGNKPFKRLVIHIPKEDTKRFRKFVGKVCRVTVEVLE
jgi:hypothetical protein